MSLNIVLFNRALLALVSVPVVSFLAIECVLASDTIAEQTPVLEINTRSQFLQQRLSASTVKDWLAQIESSESAATAQVTRVKLESTAAGLDIILETASGEPLSIDTTQLQAINNSLIVEIPNAVLVLPDGREFRAENPTDDIASVTVTQSDTARIRVSVTGVNDLPLSEVTLITGDLAYSLNPDSDEEEEIVVTGTRVEERLPDVPRSITVIPREQIQQQTNLSRNVAEILGKLVPGFAPPSQSMSLFGQSLRGRNVLVLIDGIPQSTSRNVFRDLQAINPDLIERIEVLRGPTAIYGDGATGGVINIITRKPTTAGFVAQTDIGFDTGLSNLNGSQGYRLQQSFSGRQSDFDYYVGLGFAKTEDFFDAQGDRIPPDPNAQGGLADMTQYSILAKAGLNLSDNQRLQFTLNYLNEDQFTEFTSDPIVAQIAGRQKARALRGLSLEDPQGTQNLLLNLEYSHPNLLGSRVQAQLYYRDYKTRFVPFDARAFASLGNVIFQSELQSQRLGTRLDINTPLTSDQSLKLLWGVDYSTEDTTQPVDTFDPVVLDNSGGLVFRRNGARSWTPPFEQNSLGLFAQLQWAINDRWNLLGGIRYEQVGLNVQNFTTIRGAQIGGGKLDYDATLFNVGTTYGLSEQVNVFATFAQGFSLADVGLALRNAPAGFSVASLRPEPQRVDHYEIGIRGNWNIVKASLAGFYNQSNLGTTFTAPGTVARDPQQIYGLEATLDVQPTTNLQIGATLSWAEGERDTNNDGSYDAPLSGFNIAPLKLTAYVEHQTTDVWRNRLQLLYSGSRDPVGTAFGFSEVNSYIVLDYIAQIKVGPGTLRIGVENLLNTFYFPVVSQLQTTDPEYAAARGMTLSVGYSFTW